MVNLEHRTATMALVLARLLALDCENGFGLETATALACNFFPHGFFLSKKEVVVTLHRDGFSFCADAVLLGIASAGRTPP